MGSLMQITLVTVKGKMRVRNEENGWCIVCSVLDSGQGKSGNLFLDVGSSP